MIIKFRLTNSQLNVICNKDSFPILGFCGTGDYFEEDYKFVLFSLMGVKEFKSIYLENLESPIENVPVIFLNDSYNNTQLLDMADAKLKQVVSATHHNIIGLSVWMEEKKIVSILAHYNNSTPKTIYAWSIVGSDISYFFSSEEEPNKETQLRTIQAFGEGTVRTLSSLCVGVIGASGTGSPMIEMLYRTGVGELVIVDPDSVEKKNLNRILNTSLSDAIKNKKKVEVLKEAISRYGFSTKVEALSENLFSKKVVKALSRCDIIFGCTDTADSRSLLNSIAQFYCIPYIDVGVELTADGKGNIERICGAINYVAPDGITLVGRKTITNDKITESALKRNSTQLYQQQVKDKYIKGVDVESPAVLCVNMAASSFAFLDFMSRIHSIRSDENSEYERTYINYTNMCILADNSETVSELSMKNLGRGDVNPLLNNTELSEGVSSPC